MTQRRIYLDWNATTPLRPEARAAMAAAFEVAGNPSSVHAEGRAARKLVTEARAAVAAAVGAEPRQVVFTSGGTEANMAALVPGLRRGAGAPVARLLVSAVEHPSVLGGGQFPPELVERLPVDGQGVLDIGVLWQRLQAGPPALVSLMLANNESGVIQPVRVAAERVRAAGGLLHVDAVQGLGRIPTDIKALQADLLSISGHKVGGPKGVGALVMSDDVTLPRPLIQGGGQEQNRRAGTENVPGIAGFGAAVAAAMAAQAVEAARMMLLRERLEQGLRRLPGVTVFAAGAERLPNTILVGLPGEKAETAVIRLDLAGIAVSAGAACSSGKVTRSHVLAAMGVPEAVAEGAIRISLGWTTSERDVEAALEVLGRRLA
jgi:cysteine desulfurase